MSPKPLAGQTTPAQMPQQIGPFARLRHLLADTAPAENETIFDLTIGAPRHAPPDFVLQKLQESAAENGASYGRYPPIEGLPIWQDAVRHWLARRFGLANPCPHPHQVLPVSGTREGLFLLAQLARPNRPDKTLMAMPNPFYQVYAAAAQAAGATPVYLSADKETGFLPDLDQLTPETLTQLRAFFMCSPANPQGAIAPETYLDRLLDLAENYDFLVILDECYMEIYDRRFEKNPPLSALNCAEKRPEGARNLVVFHSLSKRSNLPGLRSGFCAGGAEIMEAYYQFRLVAGPQTPVATLEAAALAWADDAHVAANRALYQEKFDVAENILAGQFGFFRPDGGFFLWLNVGNGEKACLELWQKAAIKVLPGSYLSRSNDATDPGAAYIRVALVDTAEKTEQALIKMRETLSEAGLT